MKFTFEHEFKSKEEAKKILEDWKEAEFTDQLLDFLNYFFEELEKWIEESEMMN